PRSASAAGWTRTSSSRSLHHTMSPKFPDSLTEFRTRPRAALAVIVLAALGLALLLPVRSLVGNAAAGSPALALPGLASAELAGTLSPAATQAHALRELLGLLAALAWVGVAVAAVSIFATRAATANERSVETGIRRAVGASRRQLIFSLAVETILLAVIALI